MSRLLVIVYLMLFATPSYAAITSHGQPVTPSAAMIDAASVEGTVSSYAMPIGLLCLVIAVLAAVTIVVAGIRLWKLEH